MIRRLVIGADFVILNIVLLFYTQYGQELIPAYFDKATKITFFVANAALFLGEYFYSTIIHVRKIGFLQVTKRTLYLLQQQHSVSLPSQDYSVTGKRCSPSALSSA